MNVESVKQNSRNSEQISNSLWVVSIEHFFVLSTISLSFCIQSIHVRALRWLYFVYEISSYEQYVIWVKYGVYFIMDLSVKSNVNLFTVKCVHKFYLYNNNKKHRILHSICKYFLYKMRARMFTTGKTSEKERKIECIHRWRTEMNWMKIGKTNESNISKLTVSNLSH